MNVGELTDHVNAKNEIGYLIIGDKTANKYL